MAISKSAVEPTKTPVGAEWMNRPISGTGGLPGNGATSPVGAEAPPMGAPGMNAPASPLNPSGGQPANPLAEAITGSSSGATSTGGVSAVNPQAGMADYNSLQRFEDAAYNQAMQRLDPQLGQQSDSFDQQMVNRGIPIGSEAYQEAKQQLDFNQNDARSSAAFQAMGFGQGVQNQMFGQDAQRAGLSNSLLQAQMSNQLGYSGLGENQRQFTGQFGENQRQFDNAFGETGRQFNDQSNRAWDAQGYGQMMGLEGNQFRNQMYNDSRSDYQNNLVMSMLGYGGGQQPQYNFDPNVPYGQQLGYGANQYGNQSSYYGGLYGDTVSAAGQAMGGMGGAMASDRRLKTNIRKVGTTDGYNVYRWNWNDKAKALGIDTPTIGVMSDEVPAEFVGTRDGYDTVDYGRLLNG